MGQAGMETNAEMTQRDLLKMSWTKIFDVNFSPKSFIHFQNHVHHDIVHN